MSQKEKGLPVTTCFIVCYIHVHNAVLCEKRFGDNVDRFRNGSAHESHCLNAFQISEVNVHSQEIANEQCTSSKYDAKICVQPD